MLLFNSKALLSQLKLRDAAVNFDTGTYWNLRRQRAVLPATARLSFAFLRHISFRIFYRPSNLRVVGFCYLLTGYSSPIMIPRTQPFQVYELRNTLNDCPSVFMRIIWQVRAWCCRFLTSGESWWNYRYVNGGRSEVATYGCDGWRSRRPLRRSDTDDHRAWSVPTIASHFLVCHNHFICGETVNIFVSTDLPIELYQRWLTELHCR